MRIVTELKRGRFLKQNLGAAFPHLYSVRNGWFLPSPAVCGQRARPPLGGILWSGQSLWGGKP